MMKICVKCKQEKPLDDFARNKAKKDGKQSQCRDCQREYRKAHHEKNKTKYLGMIAERKQELRDRIWTYKNSHPCVDCGESDPVVLEFDHLRDKEFNLGAAAHRGLSWERILAEIDKCEVVCANCHKRRTFGRAGWKRGILVEAPAAQAQLL